MEPIGHDGVLPQLRLDELLGELQARLQAVLDARDRMRGLLEAVVAISSGLELETMLRRIVQAAIDLADAKYGALGVIGEDRRLAQFIPVGLSEEEIRAIHHWPEGQGLLGLLAANPRPMRLAAIGDHPESSGFPDGHPVMRTFLGVPVRVRDQVFGNLYLSEKRSGGEFTEDDEVVLTALGSAAGIAIENARLYDEARRQQRWLQASSEVTTQLLSGDSPAVVLAALSVRALRLSGADLVTIELPDDDRLWVTVTCAEGDGAEQARGLVVPLAQSLAAKVLEDGRPLVVADLASEQGTTAAVRAALGHIGPAVVFPLGPRGGVRGVLIAGLRAGSPPFAPGVTALVASFAAQAGVALELAARRADAERLTVYEDRDRIARDLHDLVIQRLYATGMSLEGTMPLATRPEVRERVSNAVDAMDTTIKDIRASIFALQARPSSEPALRAGILSLADEMTHALGFAPTLRLGSGLSAPLATALADHALAVLREALSNVARHAAATKADVTVDIADGHLAITVSDNGRGIQPGNRRSGLANMAQRARALHGDLTISPGASGGTELSWRVPVAGQEDPLHPPARPAGS